MLHLCSFGTINLTIKNVNSVRNINNYLFCYVKLNSHKIFNGFQVRTKIHIKISKYCIIESWGNHENQGKIMDFRMRNL